MHGKRNCPKIVPLGVNIFPQRKSFAPPLATFSIVADGDALGTYPVDEDAGRRHFHPLTDRVKANALTDSLDSKKQATRSIITVTENRGGTGRDRFFLFGGEKMTTGR